MKTILNVFRLLFFPQPVQLSIAPFLIPAIVGGANLLTNVFSRVFGAKKRQQRLEGAAKTYEMPSGISEAVQLSRNLANRGDPYAAMRTREIEKNAADTLGMVKGSTSSVQDVLNAVQGISERKGMAKERSIASSRDYRNMLERNLTSILRSKALTKLQVDQLNQRAVEAEAARQSANMQNLASSGANISSDIFSSYLLAKQFGS